MVKEAPHKEKNEAKRPSSEGKSNKKSPQIAIFVVYFRDGLKCTTSSRIVTFLTKKLQ